MTARMGQDQDTDLAETIANDLLAHPSVMGMSGGPLGVLATHLPGRKVTGVRMQGPGEPVEVGVILRLGDPLPRVTEELRGRVRTLAGNVPVNVTVTDVTEAASESGEAGAAESR